MGADDGHGGTKVTDVLSIDQGPQTAAVADGGSWYATGHLTASDATSGDVLTWTIDNGSRYTSANYQYAIHEFSVNEGGTLAFDDTFNGTVPPAGPNILVGSSPSGTSYNVFGSGTYVQGTGEALINASRTSCGEALLCTGDRGSFRVTIAVSP